MSPELIVKISNDQKLHNYLINNSYWYKDLNRNKDNFKKFYAAYKANSRNEKAEKISGVVDTLDTVNTIFKILN
jgi:hypothetical protein